MRGEGTRCGRAALAIAALTLGAEASGSALVPQTPLPGRCIPQFVQPLPVFGPGYNAALPRVNALAHPFLSVKMTEAERQVLPPATPAPGVAGCPDVTVQPTRVWAYETSDLITGRVLGPAFWPAVTIDARRFVPATVRYVNALPAFDPAKPYGPGLVQGLLSVDQTLHWAAPQMMCMDSPDPACRAPFVGSPPAVPHLHGGEVPSAFDGNPDAWFTPDGRTGVAYRTLDSPGPGEAIYWYPNFQEPGTLWFHDHTLGATRINVYSGLEGFYFLRDPFTEPRNLPGGAYEIEMAIQDRQFDSRSQLLFPDGTEPEAALVSPPPNPDVHPFWIPEFGGDVVVVNGTPWPYLEVEPRRYQFRLLDGANARFWNLDFGAAPVWQIGTDDTYLDAPVRKTTVFIAPGERADVIVDFSGMAGQTITVTNDAQLPFPEGLVPGDDGQEGMDEVIQFRVSLPLRGADRSCNPAAGGCRRPALARTVALTDGQGRLAPGVKIDRVRQLVLKEVMGEGGPLEVLVNNTKWDGRRSPSIAAQFPADGVSELPRVGATELWQIVNLTVDAHPMHVHLAGIQVLSRRDFDRDAYLAVYEAAFGTPPVPAPLLPGCEVGAYCPGYGPPHPYLKPNADGALGGNPAIGPFLAAAVIPPLPEEVGWKDTAKAHPGQVLNILVRFAPTAAPRFLARPGVNLYPFNPTAGPGYVWHCHIVDHEDNEMMRPFRVVR